MTVIGVVSEFNPFHNGHEYLLKALRSRFDDDCCIVCVMSGDFVQRGEPAVLSKFDRAKAAVLCGADLVVELPVRWSLSSAEQFAEGSLRILHSLGVTHLGYGCETGDAPLHMKLAEFLLREETAEAVSAYMAENPELSYAAAREAIVRNTMGEAANALSLPNNLLAVEYMKAILSNGYRITPVPVLRKGAAHDGTGDDEFRSASELRNDFRDLPKLRKFVPFNSWAVCKEAMENGRCPDNDKLDIAITSRLRMMPKEFYSLLRDGADGVGDRIYSAIRSSACLTSVADAAKTKRYAHARIRRVLMNAALGITADEALRYPPYTRVLAANDTGTQYLSIRRKKADLPIITRPSSIRRYGKITIREFTLSADAHDLYVLAYNNAEHRLCGEDWKKAPFLVKKAQTED